MNAKDLDPAEAAAQAAVAQSAAAAADRLPEVDPSEVMAPAEGPLGQPAGPSLTAEDQKKYGNRLTATYMRLRKEKKVRIRIPVQHGDEVVIINGARFNIKCGEPVEVPESVAQILEQSEII